MPSGTTQLSMTSAVHRNTSAKAVMWLSSVFPIRSPRELVLVSDLK
jgi:hypothetical protein